MHETFKTGHTAAVAKLQMTAALAKWAAALDTFDGIKLLYLAPGKLEISLYSISLDVRVLLFRGSDSDIVERLSAYDNAQGKVRLVKQCLELVCQYHF